MRIVALIVRGPAKPMRALGSAKTTSPSEAKLAATPPIVGLVSTEMNSPPAVSKRARAAETLAICISESMPSCMRAPPPEPETMISGSCSLAWPARRRRELLADDAAHAAHDEGRIGDGKGHAAGADHAGAAEGRVLQPGAVLLIHELLAIGGLVDEFQRVGRLEVGIPLLEGALVEELRDPLPGGDVPVIVAFRADAERFSASLRKMVASQPGQRIQRPSGTPRLGRFMGLFRCWIRMLRRTWPSSPRAPSPAPYQVSPSGRGRRGPSTGRPIRLS